MSGPEIAALAPMLALAVAAVVAGLAAAVGLVPLARGRGAVEVAGMLANDGLQQTATVVLGAAALVCALLARGYLSAGGATARDRAGGARPPAEGGDGAADLTGAGGRRGRPEELYVLLLLATLGGVVLAGSLHVATLLLGLELASVALYGLIAYPRHRREAVAAGLRYLVLAGAASAFVVFGAALVYAATGRLDLAVLGEIAAGGVGAGGAAPGGGATTAIAGAALVVAGLGFKLALVPFHLWAPGVYRAAPAPVTAFVASVSKAGVLAVLARIVVPLAGGDGAAPLLVALAVVAAASMVTGNLLALAERDLKRLLAYSSIAHMGYLLVALLAGEGLGLAAALFYLVAYLAAVLAALGVVAASSTADGEAARIADYRGLLWRRPGLGIVLVVAVSSLAGLPATAGFVGKFQVVLAAVDAGRWALAILLVATSVVGLFYYLRVVAATVAEPDGQELPSPGGLAGAVLVALTLLTAALGVHPAPLVDWIRHAVLPG